MSIKQNNKLIKILEETNKLRNTRQSLNGQIDSINRQLAEREKEYDTVNNKIIKMRLCANHSDAWTLKELEQEFYKNHLDDAEFSTNLENNYELLECGIHYE